MKEAGIRWLGCSPPSSWRLTAPTSVAAGLCLLLGMGACSKSPPAPPVATAPAVEGPEAENPDRGRWVDLQKHPFRPEWVGGALTVGRRSPPDHLNNLLWSGGEARVYAKLFHCPFLLTEAADRGEGPFHVVPEAAEALPEVLPDGKTYRYRLKAGLTWEDGVPVTAADYAFTWELLQDPHPALAAAFATRRATLERIESVTAVDERTIEVRFKQPYYNALVAFGLEFTVVPKHAVPRDPELFVKTARHPGFGPYRILRNSPEELVFELRPEYRKQAHPTGPQYLEQVVFRYVRDATTQFQLLRQGAIDLATIPHERYEGLHDDQEFMSRLWRTYYFLPAYVFIATNHRHPEGGRPHPVLAAPEVRAALVHLSDRERLVREIYGNRAKVVGGPFFFLDADYDSSVPLRAFDPARAERLLDQAGFRVGQDGWRAKGEVKLSLELLLPAGSPELKAPAVYLSEAARAVGFEILVRELPFDPVIRQRLNERRFDAILAINSLRPAVEPDQYELLHSAEASAKGQNICAVEDSRLDRWIDAYRASADPKERLAARRSLHRAFDEIVPFPVLLSASTCLAINRRFANVKVHDLGVLYRDFVLRERFEASPPEGRK